MKRTLAILFALLLCLSLFACAKKPLEQEEVDKIIGDLNLGDKVDLDKYDDAQKEQIKDEMDKDGFIIGEDGTLAPKDPLSDEKIDEIVSDALNKGEVDLGDYDEAQKEQIKDKLEEEGMEAGKENGSTTVPVTPIPELTEAEIKDILLDWGIGDAASFQENLNKKVDLTIYPEKQLQQLKAAVGLIGYEFVEEDGATYLRGMKIHIDQVPENDNE